MEEWHLNLRNFRIRPVNTMWRFSRGGQGCRVPGVTCACDAARGGSAGASLPGLIPCVGIARRAGGATWPSVRAAGHAAPMHS